MIEFNLNKTQRKRQQYFLHVIAYTQVIIECLVAWKSFYCTRLGNLGCFALLLGNHLQYGVKCSEYLYDRDYSDVSKFTYFY